MKKILIIAVICLVGIRGLTQEVDTTLLQDQPKIYNLTFNNNEIMLVEDAEDTKWFEIDSLLKLISDTANTVRSEAWDSIAVVRSEITGGGAWILSGDDLYTNTGYEVIIGGNTDSYNGIYRLIVSAPMTAEDVALFQDQVAFNNKIIFTTNGVEIYNVNDSLILRDAYNTSGLSLSALAETQSLFTLNGIVVHPNLTGYNLAIGKTSASYDLDVAGIASAANFYAGVASPPNYTFASDPNTGMGLWNNVDELGLYAGGVLFMAFDEGDTDTIVVLKNMVPSGTIDLGSQYNTFNDIYSTRLRASQRLYAPQIYSPTDENITISNSLVPDDSNISLGSSAAPFSAWLDTIQGDVNDELLIRIGGADFMKFDEGAGDSIVIFKDIKPSGTIDIGSEGNEFDDIFTTDLFASGNIGIGTSTPGYDLEVNGGILADTINTKYIKPFDNYVYGWTNDSVFSLIGEIQNSWELYSGYDVSETKPQYRFQSDDNSGIGQSAVDQLGLTAGGRVMIQLDEGDTDSIIVRDLVTPDGTIDLGSQYNTFDDIFGTKFYIGDASKAYLYNSSNNIVIGATDGADHYTISNTYIQGGANTFRLSNVTPGVTLPNILPHQGDTDSGLGWSDDNLSLVAGGKSFIQLRESTVDSIVLLENVTPSGTIDIGSQYNTFDDVYVSDLFVGSRIIFNDFDENEAITTTPTGYTFVAAGLNVMTLTSASVSLSGQDIVNAGAGGDIGTSAQKFDNIYGSRIVNGQSTITANTDALSVAAVNSVWCNTGLNNITIGGITGGVAGQIVHIFKSTTANDLIIEHDENTGNQDIFTPDGADITLSTYGGVTIVFQGTNWYVISE